MFDRMDTIQKIGFGVQGSGKRRGGRVLTRYTGWMGSNGKGGTWAGCRFGIGDWRLQIADWGLGRRGGVFDGMDGRVRMRGGSHLGEGRGDGPHGSLGKTPQRVPEPRKTRCYSREGDSANGGVRHVWCRGHGILLLGISHSILPPARPRGDSASTFTF